MPGCLQRGSPGGTVSLGGTLSAVPRPSGRPANLGVPGAGALLAQGASVGPPPAPHSGSGSGAPRQAMPRCAAPPGRGLVSLTSDPPALPPSPPGWGRGGSQWDRLWSRRSWPEVTSGTFQPTRSPAAGHEWPLCVALFPALSGRSLLGPEVTSPRCQLPPKSCRVHTRSRVCGGPGSGSALPWGGVCVLSFLFLATLNQDRQPGRMRVGALGELASLSRQPCSAAGSGPSSTPLPGTSFPEPPLLPAHRRGWGANSEGSPGAGVSPGEWDEQEGAAPLLGEALKSRDRPASDLSVPVSEGGQQGLGEKHPQGWHRVGSRHGDTPVLPALLTAHPSRSPGGWSSPLSLCPAWLQRPLPPGCSCPGALLPCPALADGATPALACGFFN